MTVPDLLFITFQTLPSEPSGQADGLNTVETPLEAARTFSDALKTLTAWRQPIVTIVTDLQANPEPLKLFNSVRTLISHLISADNSFATEVSQMCRSTNIKSLCTDEVLLQFTGLLEIELSTRAQEDDEERRRKGQANFALSTHASASAVSKGGKGGGKRKGKSKRKAMEGKGNKKPVCQDYMTERGAQEETNALTSIHANKCLRCGATGHDLASCRRHARDVRTNEPPAAKPKASPPRLPKKEKARVVQRLNPSLRHKSTQQVEMQSGQHKRLTPLSP